MLLSLLHPHLEVIQRLLGGYHLHIHINTSCSYNLRGSRSGHRPSISIYDLSLFISYLFVFIKFSFTLLLPYCRLDSPPQLDEAVTSNELSKALRMFEGKVIGPESLVMQYGNESYNYVYQTIIIASTIKHSSFFSNASI